MRIQKMQSGLQHPHTSNWVERSKAIKRLRSRLVAQKEDGSGKEKTAVTTPGAPVVGGALTREAPPKLESTKERIEAIGDFSHLL